MPPFNLTPPTYLFIELIPIWLLCRFYKLLCTAETPTSYPEYRTFCVAGFVVYWFWIFFFLVCTYEVFGCAIWITYYVFSLGVKCAELPLIIPLTCYLLFWTISFPLLSSSYYDPPSTTTTPSAPIKLFSLICLRRASTTTLYLSHCARKRRTSLSRCAE